MDKNFSGILLIMGCGAVSRCLQAILIKEKRLDFSKIIILDPDEGALERAPLKDLGSKVLCKRLSKNTFAKILSDIVKAGDCIIDLTVNVESADIIDWCQEHGICYINTAVEWWEDSEVGTNLSSMTLYDRHMALREREKKWDKSGATAVVEHGANPGLVSHWTKKALVCIAESIAMTTSDVVRKSQLEKALKEGLFNELAYLTGTKVIHISERDTQITTKPKHFNEFVNTWSVDGLYEEATAPAELGWGTHELALPEGAHEHEFGPRNQIYLSSAGMNTWMYSWVPAGDIVGMLIRHGEAFTLSDYLTVREGHNVVYRPTVHYVYAPSDSTVASVLELKMRHYRLQSRKRILYDDIISGRDEIGVLLLGHDLNGWWEGSILSIEQTRMLIGNGDYNATTLQVAASVFAAFQWVLENPYKGYCIPDDLPYEPILASAGRYLGECLSVQTEWNPLKNRIDPITKRPIEFNTEHDLWQFKSFRVD